MKNIAQAVVKAQAKLHNLGKNANGHNYQYLTLDKLIDETRGILAECGLAILQPMADVNGEAAVKTILIHESGESIEGIYPIAKAGMRACNDAQQMGAAITYGRRYSLAAMLNIAQADDDGACIGTGTKQNEDVKVDSKSEDAWSAYEAKKESLSPVQANWCIDELNKGNYQAVVDALKKVK